MNPPDTEVTPSQPSVAKPDMTETSKKAFDTITEMTKQLLTLASAILTLTIAFAKDILKPAPSKHAIDLIQWSWGLYLLSIVCGILTLGTVAGTLANAANAQKTANPKQNSIRFFMCLQLVAFGFGTLLIVVFGWCAPLNVPPIPPAQ